MMTYALACGIQQGEVVNSVGGRIVGRVAPRLTAAVAKPEDAGLHVRRIVDRAGNGLEFASYDDRTLDGAVVADSPAIHGPCHSRVRGHAAAMHGIAEVG